MATVHVARSSAKGPALTGAAMPVPDSVLLADGSADTTGAFVAIAGLTANRGEYWTVTVTGGAAMVRFGANPAAGAAASWKLLDGQTRDFAVSGKAEKVAIKNG